MAEMTVREFASKGGNSTFKKYGADYMKELSQKAAEARKRKKLQKQA